LSARELETVSFRGNELTGSIPHDIVAAASRNVLLVDLRNNQLNGTIPSGLIDLPSNPNVQIAGNNFDSYPAPSCDGKDLGNETDPSGMNTCANMLLCPPGSWSTTGRPYNSSETCSKCPSNETAEYYGSTSCESVRDERSVLVELFHSCGGPGWYRRDFWMSPAHVCDWHGVGCSSQGDVILLNLQNNNLQCEIPAAAFQLPHLEKLDISSNPITVDFHKLSPSQRPHVSELRLSNTHVSSLSGVEALDGLTVLDASYCKLQGPFPDREVSNLRNLRVLLLSGNLLSGSLVASESADGSSFFSSEDSQRPSLLRVLKLDANTLSGSVPALSGIETLRYLSLSNNRFNGTIPLELLSHVSVTTAEGPESSSHLAMLTIDLADNALTGTVPEELSRFENASVRLLLAGNRIESVPATLCRLSPLWNDGDLTRFGCDGLLCPKGTYHATGRSTAEYGACTPCPKSSMLSSHEAAYVGQRSCPGPAAASSSAPPGRYVWWSMLASTVALTILAVVGSGAESFTSCL
jgi:hypothetical protein